MVGEILTAGWLFVMSIADAARKYIPVWMLGVQTVLATVLLVFTGISGNPDIWELCKAVLPGALLLVIAIATKKVGWADGVVLLLLGLQSGAAQSLTAALIALFMMAVLSIFLLVLRKVKKDTRLPFIPFLTVGYVLSFWGV